MDKFLYAIENVKGMKELMECIDGMVTAEGLTTQQMLDRCEALMVHLTDHAKELRAELRMEASGELAPRPRKF